MILGQLQLRRDTAANWTAANPLLLAGELALETDTKRVKLGDGATAWNALGYLIPLFADAETPTGTVDGNNKVFILANAPAPAVSLQCYLGEIQNPGGNDYTLAGKTITFVVAPQRAPLCWYRY